MAPNGITCENLNQRMRHREEKDAYEEEHGWIQAQYVISGGI